MFTRDIDASVEFYRDVLGLQETFRTPTDGTPEHVELAAGGLRWGSGRSKRPSGCTGWIAHPVHPAMSVVFWTEDVDTTYAKLVAAGAKKVTESHDVGNNNRNAVVWDLDGNLVELVAKRS